MEIKPVKKVKPVKQSQISTDDFMRRPKIKSPPLQPGEARMEFVNRQILMDGKEVGKFIKDTSMENPALLSKIASELEKFKKRCLKKRKKKFRLFSKQPEEEYDEEQLSVIFALCDAYIARVSELIKKRYEETKDGLSLIFDDEGNLILNGMNIHALVQQCEENPNPKSITFLKGIKARLELVLETKVNSRNYEHIHEVILKLFEKIDKILK